MNQTKITASSPGPDGEVSVHLVVDSGALAKADPQAFEDLQVLIGAALARRGGNPAAASWSCEPIGPQARLVAVNGALI